MCSSWTSSSSSFLQYSLCAMSSMRASSSSFFFAKARGQAAVRLAELCELLRVLLLQAPGFMRHCQLPPRVEGVFMRAQLPRESTSCIGQMHRSATLE